METIFDNVGEDKKEFNVVEIKRFNPRPYTLELLKKFKVFRDCYKRFWLYNEKSGLWFENADEVLEKELRKRLFKIEDIKSHYVTEILRDIKGITYQDVEPPYPDKKFVPFANGIVDLETGDFLGFSSEFFFTSKLAIDFNPEAKCPEIERIFSQYVPSKRIVDLFELPALCMYRSYPVQKAHFLEGPGESGRSTYTRIIERMLGCKNVSSVTLKQIQENQFAAADLFGKYANISVEVEIGRLNQTELFKQLTGGDTIRAERKFKDSFNFRNFANLIFAMNELPETKDTTSAFYRRVHLIRFPNKFPSRSPKTVKELADKLPEKEIEGLGMKCLEILRQMYTNGFPLSNDEEPEVIAKTYDRLANPLQSFLEESCIRDPNGAIGKEEFRTKFNAYLRKQGRRIWSAKQMGSKMRDQYGIEGGLTGPSDKRKKAWFGIQWR